LAGRIPALLSDDTKRTATVERVADPNAFDFEAAWEAEWNRNLWDAAVARVKLKVRPKQFQMFDLYVVKEWPVKEVARALGVTATQVYVNKHRVAARIEAELRALRPKLR
jgi:RNA polymerase sigma-70 factor (ECF subfamily)